MTLNNPGLIAWLRGLPHRRPKHQVDTRDPIDQRFSAMAVEHGLARLHELPDYIASEDRPYVLLVELTAAGARAVAETP